MNQLLQSSFATCSFELRRSLTFQRVAVTVVLALFPPMMLALLIFGTQFSDSGASAATATRVVTIDPNTNEIIDEGPVVADSGSSQSNAQPDVVRGFSTFVSIFLIALVVLLSLLLWATPNVYSELEGKSWNFIACRPGGRISVFLGKYMASVLIACAISVASVSLCVLLATQALGILQPVRLWSAMTGVFIIASFIYGALFSLIGTLFFKRAMVVAAGYLILFDIFLASIPGALMNKFTIRYHLQEIGVQWIGWFFPRDFGRENEFRMIYGEAWPVWVHLIIVFAAIAFILAMGIKTIVSREYITSDKA